MRVIIYDESFMVQPSRICESVQVSSSRYSTVSKASYAELYEQPYGPLGVNYLVVSSKNKFKAVDLAKLRADLYNNDTARQIVIVRAGLGS